MYDDCDKRHKRCFGDTDVCIGFRNCTFAVSIMENRTHFQVITLNKCDEEAKNYYIGVGLTTWDARVSNAKSMQKMFKNNLKFFANSLIFVPFFEGPT